MNNPKRFSCKSFFFIQNKLLYHYITNNYKFSLFCPWKKVIIDIETVHLGAFTPYTHGNGDKVPAAGAACAADSTEACREERSRQRGTMTRVMWKSCALPRPPCPATAAPFSTLCACSGTRSSPESRRGAGPRRYCAAPALTGSGTSGSCAPASAAAPVWTRCGSDDSWSSCHVCLDTETSCPACNLHPLEDVSQPHLWRNLLKFTENEQLWSNSHSKSFLWQFDLSYLLLLDWLTL